MPGKTLNTQAQQFVLNLLEYFEMEKENGGPLESLSSVQERVAAALQISRRTVYSIKKRKENNSIWPPPTKHRTRKHPKTTDLPDSIKMTVRDTLYDMYKDKKQVTLKTLNDQLRAKEIISVSIPSLSTLLKEMGFTFRKDDNRWALIERTDIASKRACFLHKYRENHNSAQSYQINKLEDQKNDCDKKIKSNEEVKLELKEVKRRIWVRNFETNQKIENLRGKYQELSEKMNKQLGDIQGSIEEKDLAMGHIESLDADMEKHTDQDPFESLEDTKNNLEAENKSLEADMEKHTDQDPFESLEDTKNNLDENESLEADMDEHTDQDPFESLEDTKNNLEDEIKLLEADMKKHTDQDPIESLEDTKHNLADEISKFKTT